MSKNCDDDGSKAKERLGTRARLRQELDAFSGGDEELAQVTDMLYSMTMSDPDPDDPLFQNDPPREECPLCCLPMPFSTGQAYLTCCGKSVCSGCIYAHVSAMETSNTPRSCGFCRTPVSFSDKTEIQRLKNRMDAGDAEAFHFMACNYSDGARGLSQNEDKAMELWGRAAELGSLRAHSSLAYKFMYSEQNAMKGMYHYAKAAMGGDESSRHVLGILDDRR